MKDLWNQGCYDGRSNPQEFERMFCRRCRNPDCVRAGWSKDLFGERVISQRSLLLQPQEADPADPRYRRIRGMDFPDLLREAVRLESADARGDWTLPGEAVHLAPIPREMAPDESEDLVEKAARALRKEQDPPDPLDSPPPESEDGPGHPVPVGGHPVPSGGHPVPPGFVPPHNTESPREGLMVGGGEPEPAPPEDDPWTPKKKTPVVQPGATIKMGETDE
jgi:hypothetical protein